MARRPDGHVDVNTGRSIGVCSVPLPLSASQDHGVFGRRERVCVVLKVSEVEDWSTTRLCASEVRHVRLRGRPGCGYQLLCEDRFTTDRVWRCPRARRYLFMLGNMTYWLEQRHRWMRRDRRFMGAFVDMAKDKHVAGEARGPKGKSWWSALCMVFPSGLVFLATYNSSCHPIEVDNQWNEKFPRDAAMKYFPRQDAAMKHFLYRMQQ